MAIEATEKQKRAADNIIKQKIVDGNVNKGKALRDAGYSESVSKAPQLVTESVGFLAYMEKNDITENNLAAMLSQDLKNKPGERLGELKLAAQLMGLDGAKDSGNNVQINFALNKIQEIIDGETIDGEDI